MVRERLFLDTAFAQALLSPHDRYHFKAKTLFARVKATATLWTTELILIEIGDALSKLNRQAAYNYINQVYSARNSSVVSIDTTLFKQGLTLYHSRPDKTWGLTDCISFVVMRDNGLQEALTSDKHFVQAGFRALLLEDN